MHLLNLNFKLPNEPTYTAYAYNDTWNKTSLDY